MWDKIKAYLSSNYKPKQTAKSSPSASSTDVAFIDTISQDANGVITATKKTVRSASTSQSGLCPQLAGGTTKFLRADGSWAVPSGSGGGVTTQFSEQTKSYATASERVQLASGTTAKNILTATAPLTGYAFITGHVQITTNASKNRHAEIQVDGTQVASATTLAPESTTGMVFVAAVYPVTSGDTIALAAWQNSGSTLYAGGRLNVLYMEV